MNGLVDLPEPNPGDLSILRNQPKLRVYRLITTGDFSQSSRNMSSVESSLFRNVACRLLPNSVFHSHSTIHLDRRSLLFARVQPNVVHGFLNSFCHPNKINRQSLPPHSSSASSFFPNKLLNVDVGQTGIKCELFSYSSPSSIASSFSCTGPDHRVDEFGGAEKIIDDDESMLFQEREPLSKQLVSYSMIFLMFFILILNQLMLIFK